MIKQHDRIKLANTKNNMHNPSAFTVLRSCTFICSSLLISNSQVGDGGYTLQRFTLAWDKLIHYSVLKAALHFSSNANALLNYALFISLILLCLTSLHLSLMQHYMIMSVTDVREVHTKSKKSLQINHFMATQ